MKAIVSNEQSITITLSRDEAINLVRVLVKVPKSNFSQETRIVSEIVENIKGGMEIT
jgi:hypothetical protein